MPRGADMQAASGSAANLILLEAGTCSGCANGAGIGPRSTHTVRLSTLAQPLFRPPLYRLVPFAGFFAQPLFFHGSCVVRRGQM